MDYQKFTEEMKEQVQERLGDKYEVSVQNVCKLNGKDKTGISIREKERTMQILPVFYLEKIFEAFRQGRSMQDCVEEVCDFYEEQKEKEDHMLRKIVDIEKIREWDKVKTMIYPILVSEKTNEKLKEVYPYRTYMDLLVFYIIRISAADTGNIKITKKMLEEWGICEEELYVQAMENMKGEGYRLQSMESLMNEILQGEEEEEVSLPDSFMYVLTNHSKYFGAAGMLICDKVFEKCFGQKNFYILPSSIHELILIPDTGAFSESELNSMVKQVNREQVLPEEVLADHVYYYDWETRQMESRE